MKVFIAVLAIVAGICNGEWVPKTSEQIKQLRADCLVENPLSDELLAKIRVIEYPDTEAIHKFVLCAVTKLGIFNKDEGFSFDHVGKQFKFDELDEAEVMEIAKRCADKNEQGSSAEVWAYRGFKCLVDSKIGEVIREHIRRAVNARKN